MPSLSAPALNASPFGRVVPPLSSSALAAAPVVAAAAAAALPAASAAVPAAAAPISAAAVRRPPLCRRRRPPPSTPENPAGPSFNGFKVPKPRAPGTPRALLRRRRRPPRVVRRLRFRRAVRRGEPPLEPAREDLRPAQRPDRRRQHRPHQPHGRRLHHVQGRLPTREQGPLRFRSPVRTSDGAGHQEHEAPRDLPHHRVQRRRAQRLHDAHEHDLPLRGP